VTSMETFVNPLDYRTGEVALSLADTLLGFFRALLKDAGASG